MTDQTTRDDETKLGENVPTPRAEDTTQPAQPVETPKTDQAIADANARISPEITSRSAPVNAKEVAEMLKPLDHPPAGAKSVFYKGPGGWAKLNRDGDRWVMDPADYTSRPEDYFDNYEGNGIPVVNSLD